MDYLAQIKRDYPQFWYLFNEPSVGPLLKKAVDPNSPFSPDEFQAQLYGTKYFRTKSQKQREWHQLRMLDPAEARRRANNFKRSVRVEMANLGFKMNEPEVKWITTLAMNNGEDISDPGFAFNLHNYIRRQSMRRWAAGNLATQRDFVNNRAYNDYYVPMTKQEIRNWSSAIALGINSQQDLDRVLQQKAMSRYPHMYEALRRGNTMEELIGDRRQMIANELEINPAQVNMLSGNWSKVLDYYDKDSKTHRTATLSETQRMARQDQRFWNTSKGKALSAQRVNDLAQMFGRKA